MFYIYTPRKGQKTSGGIEMEYWLEIVQGCVCPIGVAMLSFSRYFVFSSNICSLEQQTEQLSRKYQIQLKICS